MMLVTLDFIIKRGNMRSYQCNVSCYVDGELVQSAANACWSMLQCPQYFGKKGASLEQIMGREIYISDYECQETEQYQDLLIAIINEVTHCSKVRIGRKNYIKFHCLATYDQSLVLLNFIRNLWHNPGSTSASGYTNKFFGALEKSREVHEDPVSRLTWANKEACSSSTSGMYGGSPGHSNVHPADTLVIRTARDLLDYNGHSTGLFLQGDSPEYSKKKLYNYGAW